MITKLLVTFGVMLSIMVLMAYNRRQMHGAAGAYSKRNERSRNFWRRYRWQWWVAGAIGLSLAAGGWGWYLDWQQDHQVVRVKIISSQGGEAAEYQAYRGAIQERSFMTLDGRHIQLAEQDRLEWQLLPGYP